MNFKDNITVFTQEEMNQQMNMPMSQESQYDEICPLHNDFIVAVNKYKNELLCNKCIYQDWEDNELASEQLTFTSYVASNLKDLFDEKFDLYQKQMGQMKEVAPNTITSTLQKTVNDFFKSIEIHIRAVEKQIMEKVSQSQNLKQLDQILENEKELFGLAMEKKFEQGKQEIDTNTSRGHFSQVVQKKQTYQELIDEMNRSSIRLKNAVNEGQKRIDRAVVIKGNKDGIIGKRLNEIVDTCLEIDLRKGAIQQRLSEGGNQAQIQDALRRKFELELLEKQQAENLRLQQEQQRKEEEARAEQERLEQQERQRQEEARLEQQRLEQRKLELQRIEQQKLEQQRIEQQKLEEQRLEVLKQQQLEEQRRQEEQRKEEERKRFEEEAKLKALEEERKLQEKLRIEQEKRLEEERLNQQIQMQKMQEEQQRLQLEAQAAAFQAQQQQQQQQMQQMLEEQQRLQQEAQAEAFQAQQQQQQEAVQDKNQVFYIQEEYQANYGYLQDNIQNQQDILIDDQQYQFNQTVQSSNQYQLQQFEQVETQKINLPQMQQSEQQDILLDTGSYQIDTSSVQGSSHMPSQLSQAQLEELIPAYKPASQEEQKRQLVEQETIVIEDNTDSSKLQFGRDSYKKFYRLKSQAIQKISPKSINTYKEKNLIHLNNLFMQKVIWLPNKRAFVIGGAEEISGSKATKNVSELVVKRDKSVQLIERSPMNLERAAFGCAIYPNHTQIFVAGGAISRDQTTKQCERYIVETDHWKRLPDLTEPKFSASLCFQSNGNTLYCFGGIEKNGPEKLSGINTIERLSKGQNSWQQISLKLPFDAYDMYCIDMGNDEILLLGGFIKFPSDKVFSFKKCGSQGEHTIEELPQTLKVTDFFLVNGTSMMIPPEQNYGKKEVLFLGHTALHCMDLETRQFRVLECQ